MSDDPGRRPVRVVDGALAAAALILGVAIAAIDSRPTWDDTGITVGCLVLAAGATSLAGLRPWLAAILVGAPLMVVEWRALGAGLLVVAAVTLAGAYVGRLLRRAIWGSS